MLDDYARLARTLAAAARAETLPLWRGDAAVENKQGGGGYDPVTEADRAAERAMRTLIAAAFPDHDVSGEEYGAAGGAARWRWSLDPIDGTRAYVCGLPSFTTLIGLLEEGRPVLGLIDAPALDELYIGWGGQARLETASGGRAIRVSGCAALAEARLASTDPALFSGGDTDRFARLARACRITRYGLDGYGYARLAAGSLDLVVEAKLQPHDIEAAIALIEAAGGTVTDWSGGRDFAAGRVVAAATPQLRDAALEELAR
jgi:histidinol phosphatase-like enzyme (inositol monophosphatase family)